MEFTKGSFTAVCAAPIPQYSRLKVIAGGQVDVAGMIDPTVGTNDTMGGVTGKNVSIRGALSEGKQIRIADGAIAAGAKVYTAALGRVSATKGAGALFEGFAVTATTAAGDLISIVPAVGG